jgi:NAD kinase/nicotinic acid mononucleotide adenylyltransferase
MSRRLALFGGTFNPPGTHHRLIAQKLAEKFDEVIVVPCGPRPDKPVTNDVQPIYRATMVDMTFRRLDRVRVELFDLEASTFTQHCELEARFGMEGEIWHVVEAPWLENGAAGRSRLQSDWERGQELWKAGRFAVLAAQGASPKAGDLPPRHEVLHVPAGPEPRIRDRVFNHQPIQGLVTADVAAYIERHRLYRGGATARSMMMRLGELRPLIFADARSPEALELSRRFRAHDARDANVILVIGGDGTMLHAIREHWRLRLPFYGVNTGHIGFLLNDKTPEDYLSAELVVAQMPLLYVQTVNLGGQQRAALAFNDAWVERETGQTAWIEVKVNGEVRLPKLVADGALLATAAGSTAYAHAMGATPVPFNSPVLLLVGSNVLRPHFWRPVVLPLESEVELTSLDPAKRPLHGYIDGVSQGKIQSMHARVSHIAAAELLFSPQHDPAAKLARIQFPLPREGD